MKKFFFAAIFPLFFLTACSVKNYEQFFKQKEIERIISALSSDEMKGREVFTPGIEKAANFIENEFSAIGLQPLKGETDYRQEFSINSISPGNFQIKVNGMEVNRENVIVITDKPALLWNNSSDAEIQYIRSGESFMNRYKSLISMNKPLFVYVDAQFYDFFKRMRDHFMKKRMVDSPDETEIVFVLGEEESVNSFSVSFNNKIEKKPLFNIAGMIPGKSRPEEVVIFSAHYDHIGILKPVAGDSIANGADDDASGVTAVISLAKYFKHLNQNERTLIFVAFTAEETGGMGSQYFSRQQNPEDIAAMFNIEMIGKESKFGKNSAFITGFDKSDFGSILQKNLKDTQFTFYPDPYPEQNLFYRSDNATLAALGVPAHTISTDQIDSDKYYHTVNDEFATLDINNITATIKAIAASAESIISGKDTPTRLEKVSPD